MSYQDGRKAAAVRRPSTEGAEAWKAYWQADDSAGSTLQGTNASRMQENRLLTTKEVADELKVSERWVTKQIQDGKLEAIDLGKGYRIYRSKLDRFLRVRQTRRDN